MTPISTFEYQRGWNTILEICAVILTMAVCTAFINRSLQVNAKATRQVMVDTYQVIAKQSVTENRDRENLQTQLDLIKKAQELELDRLMVQSDMIKALERKYSK